MSSTACSVRTIVPRCSGRVGAIEKPQLPATTDVTPCQHDDVQTRIPEHLRVVVGVDVEEPGRDVAAGRVDHGVAGEVVAHRDDAPVVHGHVGAAGGRAGAVDHGAPSHDDVSVHRSPLLGVGDHGVGHRMAEQLRGVAPRDLVGGGTRQVPDLAPQDLLRVGPGAVEVRVVGLHRHVVLTDVPDHVERRLVLERAEPEVPLHHLAVA